MSELNKTVKSPIGISVPITNGNSGYFQQTFDTNSKVKQNLLNFLKTNKGERPMFRNFGSSLREICFDQITDGIDIVIKKIITEELSIWVPEISVKKILVENKEDENSIYIKIEFLITQTDESDSIVIELKNNRI